MIYSNKPIKLLDCREYSAAELFIVEGDSAALSVSKMRNAQFQAVLPMQGKPINAHKASAQKVLDNPLFAALQTSIGAGVGAAFNLQKCRYQRIILLMDPDADGIHCGALMLLFFYRFMPALLEKGYIQMARPPVGEVRNNLTKVIDYAYTDAQFMALINTQKALPNQQFESVKYRGLAGIDANKLEQFCINPQTRKTSLMGIKDAEMALEIFGGDSS